MVNDALCLGDATDRNGVKLRSDWGWGAQQMALMGNGVTAAACDQVSSAVDGFTLQELAVMGDSLAAASVTGSEVYKILHTDEAVIAGIVCGAEVVPPADVCPGRISLRVYAVVAWVLMGVQGMRIPGINGVADLCWVIAMGMISEHNHKVLSWLWQQLSGGSIVQVVSASIHELQELMMPGVPDMHV